MTTASYLNRMTRLLLLLALASGLAPRLAARTAIKPERGPYIVGLWDTVLIHPTERFPYGDYSGGKPFFVQVWYPLAERPSGAALRLGDLLGFHGRDRAAALHDSTMVLWRQTIVRDGLMPDRRKTFEPDHTWPGDSLQVMLALLLEQPMEVFPGGQAAEGRFPLVIYHHGAQSMPFENHLLCEALASRGFVVVASGFNLANDLMPDGLLRSMEGTEPADDLLFVLDFARRLPMADADHAYGVGFSAGAQALLQLDMRPGPKPLRAIVCLHTTLEDKSVAYITEKGWWEDLLPIIRGEAVHATTPTWLLAPQNWYIVEPDSLEGGGAAPSGELRFKAPLFEPFQANRKFTPYRFITVQYPLAHDGFISMGNWRYLLRERFAYPDRRELEREYRGHLAVNRLVADILQWHAAGADPREEWLLLPFTTESP